jgi:hypothetical protein
MAVIRQLVAEAAIVCAGAVNCQRGHSLASPRVFQIEQTKERRRTAEQRDELAASHAGHRAFPSAIGQPHHEPTTAWPAGPWD